MRAEYIPLACLSNFEVLTAQDVARISRRPRNTISRAVHRMLDEGYLERAPDPENGRQARLCITDAGRALHVQVAAYLTHRQDAVLAGLSATERMTLQKILKKAVLHTSNLDYGQR